MQTITLKVEDSIAKKVFDFINTLNKSEKEQVSYTYINDIGEEILVENGVEYLLLSEDEQIRLDKVYKEAKSRFDKGEYCTLDDYMKKRNLSV